MKKSLPAWAFGILGTVGVVMVVSMVFAWVDAFGQTTSGLRLALDANHWLFLVPAAGALLVAAASTRSEYTRIAAIAAGAVVSGDVMFQFAKGLLHSGVDSWLVFGGAAVILGGISDRKRSWRIAGGAAVLAGFFAPWTHESMFRALWAAGDVFGDMFSFRVLWLVPVAGATAIFSGAQSAARGGKLALASGLAVYGSFLWVIGSAAVLVLGWGAWAAFGASTVALVLGLFARQRTAAV
jgi:hypothetical protein